jgi:hypothetical protein
MAETIGHSQIDKIIKEWQLGVQMDLDGYEDLGITIQLNALREMTQLSQMDREKIADLLFPIE